MSGGELHLEIIGLAQADETGQLGFPPEARRQLRERFCSALESPEFPAAVEGYVRAVAAFQAGGQGEAATQLLTLGAEVVAELRDRNAPAADKLQASVTGAENLAGMRPVGGSEPPPGAVRATAFIRPPPKQRG